MSDKKISQLTGSTLPLSGTEQVPVVQGGVTVKTTAQAVANLAPAELPTQVIGDSGKFLQASGTGTVSYQSVPNELPSQTGNNGKFLQTDGSVVSWQTAGASYKVYTASIVMATGVATVFQNTLGATPSWTAASGSISTNVFALVGQNNVFVQATSAASSASPKIVSGFFAPTPWSVTIQQIDYNGVNDSTQSVFVEIRVYP